MQNKFSFFSLETFGTKASCFAMLVHWRRRQISKDPQICQIPSQKLFRNEENYNKSTKMIEKAFYLLNDIKIFRDTMIYNPADKEWKKKTVIIIVSLAQLTNVIKNVWMEILNSSKGSGLFVLLK